VRLVDDPGLAGDPADRRHTVEAGELADEEGTEDDPDDEGSTSDDRDSGDVERDAPASRR
jgi:hypothetical protein